jgi:hypothetical protein
VWNKIYDGIDVEHADRVRSLAANGHEIIYVPCHKSHMDYLLLTYVIYHEGLVTPHIENTSSYFLTRATQLSTFLKVVAAAQVVCYRLKQAC